MLLRCLAFVVILLSFAFPAQATITIVQPCPSQPSLMACSMEAIVQSSNSRIQVDANCGVKYAPAQDEFALLRSDLPQKAAFVERVNLLVGIRGEGIDRPPKDCCIAA